MPKVGRALRDHRRVMAQPFTPRTLEEEERAGYEAGCSMRGVPPQAMHVLVASFTTDTRSADPVTAARARGTLRGLQGHCAVPTSIEVGTYRTFPLDSEVPQWEFATPQQYTVTYEGSGDEDAEAATMAAATLRRRGDVTRVTRRGSAVSFWTKADLDTGYRTPITDAIGHLGGILRRH